jgi:hypothetical protein
MDLELLVKIEGEARRAVRALNLKTAAKRGPTFAEGVAALPRRRPLGGPESYTTGTRPYPQNPQNPRVLRVLRVPIHDPFLDQPAQWGFS